MRHVRRLVYRLGFRPRLGSVFHSPTLSWRLEMGEIHAALVAGIEAGNHLVIHHGVEGAAVMVGPRIASLIPTDYVLTAKGLRTVSPAAERISALDRSTMTDTSTPADTFATDAGTVAQWANLNPEQFVERVRAQSVDATHDLIRVTEQIQQQLRERASDAAALANRLRSVLGEASHYSTLPQDAPTSGIGGSR